MAGALQTLTVRPERMRSSIDSFMMATDLADYLVGKGIPFREAHTWVGKAVVLPRRQAWDSRLPDRRLPGYLPAFEKDVYAVLDPMKSVERRNVIGGTAPESVKTDPKAKELMKE